MTSSLLCPRCARQLRLEMYRAVRRSGGVDIFTTAYLAGSGYLWFWPKRRVLVVAEPVLDQVRSWMPRTANRTPPA